MINNLHQNVLNEPNLKIILRVDDRQPFVKGHPVVVEAQRRLAEKDVNIVFSSMLGLPNADGPHLTPAGLMKHGKRIFEAYIEMFPEFSVEKLDNTLESK